MKKTLKAGTIVKIQGFPVELMSDVEAESGNWAIIEKFQGESANTGDGYLPPCRATGEPAYVADLDKAIRRAKGSADSDSQSNV